MTLTFDTRKLLISRRGVFVSKLTLSATDSPLFDGRASEQKKVAPRPDALGAPSELRGVKACEATAQRLGLDAAQAGQGVS